MRKLMFTTSIAALLMAGPAMANEIVIGNGTGDYDFTARNSGGLNVTTSGLTGGATDLPAVGSYTFGSANFNTGSENNQGIFTTNPFPAPTESLSVTIGAGTARAR